MRKIVYSINVSIDGCCDHTKMVPTEGMLEFFADLLLQADMLVYGRITYQLMVPYWPDVAKNGSPSKAELNFARAFDTTKKLVFSRTMRSVDDKNSLIARGDLEAEILKLKKEVGKDILVGGVDLPSQLTALGLIDEYLFVINPVIAGKGRRLFEDLSLPEKLGLTLVRTESLESGHVALRYVRP
ncbi:MAG TPA: dihydrofolate reductase family protein [Puia sp.]|nr:dihydrofolate reductase family protein [Puia sp.]